MRATHCPAVKPAGYHISLEHCYIQLDNFPKTKHENLKSPSHTLNLRPSLNVIKGKGKGKVKVKGKGKVKRKCKGKVIPLQARSGPVGRGIALLFHDCGTRRW